MRGMSLVPGTLPFYREIRVYAETQVRTTRVRQRQVGGGGGAGEIGKCWPEPFPPCVCRQEIYVVVVRGSIVFILYRVFHERTSFGDSRRSLWDLKISRVS